MKVTAADREAARNLIARQKFCIDDDEVAGVAQCWASNARLELHVNGAPPRVIEGRDTILSFRTSGGTRNGHPHIHLITTLEIIDREDGGLGAESYCAYLSTAGDFQVLGYGRYSDILAFEDGAWRLQSRTVKITANFG